MSSLNSVINIVEGMQADGDIDMAIEYCELLNEPMLSLGQYKQLKQYLDEYYTLNNRRVSSDIELGNSRPYFSRQDYQLITEQLSNVQEEYEDDFI